MDDVISRQAAIDAVKKNTFRLTFAEEQNCEGHVAWSANAVYSDVIEGELRQLPSAQPEPCEDAVSREEAKWVVFCNRDHVEDQANAIDALPPVTLKAEQPDLSEYSDKLWRNAYERGRAEAQRRWIPCSERLPDDLGDYLVSIKRIGWNMEEYVENDIAYWDDLEGFHKADEVLAWMPLPEPYREEGD